MSFLSVVVHAAQNCPPSDPCRPRSHPSPFTAHRNLFIPVSIQRHRARQPILRSNATGSKREKSESARSVEPQIISPLGFRSSIVTERPLPSGPGCHRVICSQQINMDYGWLEWPMGVSVDDISRVEGNTGRYGYQLARIAGIGHRSTLHRDVPQPSGSSEVRSRGGRHLLSGVHGGRDRWRP